MARARRLTTLVAAFAVSSASAAPLAVRTPSEAAFPSAARLFGGAPDPLASLMTQGEDLRDAVAEPPASALQAGLRSPSAGARLAAVRDAGFPRDVEAVPHLSGVLLRLDQPTRLRAAAALALGRIGDRVAVPALGEALKDPAPEVRYAAALALGRLPADGVATRLERVLKNDPVWQARYAAAIALGRTRRAFAAGILADVLAQDQAWQVRQQAARSLQDIGTPHAAQALAAALRDPDPSVRAAAGAALAAIGAPDQRQAVVEALRTEREPSVRAVLAAATRAVPARL